MMTILGIILLILFWKEIVSGIFELFCLLGAVICGILGGIWELLK